MRAARIERFGEPGELREAVVQVPSIDRRRQVLVAVSSAAVNRSDLLNLAGAFAPTTLPRIPGRDFAGTIVDGHHDLVGRGVWGAGCSELGFTRDGSHAEYVVLGRDEIAWLPSGADPAAYGASGVAFVTAAMATVDLAAVKSTETVLVVGVEGAVGSAAAQISSWLGAEVLGVPSPRRSAGAMPLPGGARPVRPGPGRSLGEALGDVSGGRSIRCRDRRGHRRRQPGGVVSSMAPRGRIIALTAIGEPTVRIDLREFYRRELRLLGLNTSRFETKQGIAALAGLAAGFEQGALAPIPVQRPIR